MPYEDNYTNHLNDIITLIKNNKLYAEGEALDKFNSYLDSIQNIGSFSLDDWRQDWRSKIWRVGEQFKELNPQRFLQACDKKLALDTTQNKEVIEFIRSEIAFNFLPDTECKKQLEILITKYPLNPEFRHTLGHYFARENQKLSAISEYKLALKIEPENSTYLKSRFSAEYSYLNELIANGNYTIAETFVQGIYAENFYRSREVNYHNTFVDFSARIADHLVFQKKLTGMESEFRNMMQSEFDKERKRIIEILGFFSAIVAFILSTVSIGKNFSFIEASYFIIALGIILILFATTLAVLFSTSKSPLLKDFKFWILVVGLILLFLFIANADIISNILQKFIYR